MAKQNFIRISENIWNDPDIRGLSKGASLLYVFLIAWSKASSTDGVVGDFAVRQCGGDKDEVQELADCGLMIPLDNGKHRIARFVKWQNTSDELESIRESRSRAGAAGAASRWGKGEQQTLPLDQAAEGTASAFDATVAFAECWKLWPAASEPKYREKRMEAYEAFCKHITDPETYASFKAALHSRLAYHTEHAEERKYLGAFRNFVQPDRWERYIPTSQPVIATSFTPGDVTKACASSKEEEAEMLAFLHQENEASTSTVQETP